MLSDAGTAMIVVIVAYAVLNFMGADGPAIVDHVFSWPGDWAGLHLSGFVRPNDQTHTSYVHTAA